MTQTIDDYEHDQANPQEAHILSKHSNPDGLRFTNLSSLYSLVASIPTRLVLAVITILFVGTTLVYAQGGYTVLWTVDTGGGTSSGGNYALSGTAGQADASEPLTGGQFAVRGGFWHGRTTDNPRPPGPSEIYLPLTLIVPTPTPTPTPTTPTGAVEFINDTDGDVTFNIQDVGERRFAKSATPHVWSGINVGVYHFLITATCNGRPLTIGSVGNPDKQEDPIIIQENPTLNLGRLNCG